MWSFLPRGGEREKERKMQAVLRNPLFKVEGTSYKSTLIQNEHNLGKVDI